MATQQLVASGQSGAPASPAPLRDPQYQPESSEPQNDYNTTESYVASSGRVTGWVQVGCAIACVVFGVIQIGIGSQFSIFGAGIWSGVMFFLPTGILGIISQKKKTNVIVAYMVMSIISAVVGFIVVCMGCAAAGVSSDKYCTHIRIWLCGYDVMRARIAFDSLLAITGLLELIIAIIAACMCCAGVCCGHNKSLNNTAVYATPVVMTLPPYGQNFGGHQIPIGYAGQQPFQIISQHHGVYPRDNGQAGNIPAPNSQVGGGPVAYPQPGNSPVVRVRAGNSPVGYQQSGTSPVARPGGENVHAAYYVQAGNSPVAYPQACNTWVAYPQAASDTPIAYPQGSNSPVVRPKAGYAPAAHPQAGNIPAAFPDSPVFLPKAGYVPARHPQAASAPEPNPEPEISADLESIYNMAVNAPLLDNEMQH